MSAEDFTPVISQARWDNAVSLTPGGWLTALHLRNMESLMQAQQTAFEGSINLMQHQIEAFTSTIVQIVRTNQQIVCEPSPIASLRMRFAALKTAMRTCIGNANTATEIAARSNAEVAQELQNRVFEVLNETEAALERSMQGSEVSRIVGSLDDRGLQ